MSILSANTLFHFTKKEYLLNILKEGFYPRYSTELDASLGDQLTLGTRWSIPMVCFCDIPMGSIKNHIDIYGSYGIGLKKDWGIKQKLNPVYYTQKNSTVIEKLVISIHDQMISSLRSGVDLSDLAYIYRYLKPYECGGVYKKGGKEYPRYRYYDEKEWRYVPSSKELDSVPDALDGLDKVEVEKKNDELKKFSLKFTARDINFIIVESDNDVDEVLATLATSNILSSSDQKHILSSLITTDKIRDNF